MAVPLTRRDTAVLPPICLILPDHHAQFPVTIWGRYRFSVPCCWAARPRLCLYCRGLIGPGERLTLVLL